MAQIIKINDTRDEALSIFSSGLSEPQLLHYFEPEPGVFFAESPRVISRALDGGYEPMMMICREEELSGETEQVIARCGEMPVY
ncbi:MAG TPA: RNA methyltransferase, partial [Ruminococcus sp.]|nr:RNA methyltransferase [Ruminococcus sp.]